MKNLTRFEKIRLFILFCLILMIIAFVGYTIYNNFIKIALVEKLDELGILVYKNIRYKECGGSHDVLIYKDGKCLGRMKGTNYSVFTVKNDSDNLFLLLEGFLSHSFYVKESMYEQHKLTHIINENE